MFPFIARQTLVVKGRTMDSLAVYVLTFDTLTFIGTAYSNFKYDLDIIVVEY